MFLVDRSHPSIHSFIHSFILCLLFSSLLFSSLVIPFIHSFFLPFLSSSLINSRSIVNTVPYKIILLFNFFIIIMNDIISFHFFLFFGEFTVFCGMKRYCCYVNLLFCCRSNDGFMIECK